MKGLHDVNKKLARIAHMKNEGDGAGDHHYMPHMPYIYLLHPYPPAYEFYHPPTVDLKPYK